MQGSLTDGAIFMRKRKPNTHGDFIRGVIGEISPVFIIASLYLLACGSMVV